MVLARGYAMVRHRLALVTVSNCPKISNNLFHFSSYFISRLDGMENSLDPDQTAPYGSESTLFAHYTLS